MFQGTRFWRLSGVAAALVFVFSLFAADMASAATCAIAVTAHENGKVGGKAGAYTATVTKGGKKIFAIKPDKDYHLKEVKVNNGVVFDGTVNSDPQRLVKVSSSSNIYNYTFLNVQTNQTLEVTFEKDTFYDVTVTAPTDGSGTVKSSPKGIINCGKANGTCTAQFKKGSTVVLTASPAANYSVSGWTGDCSASASAKTCTLAALDGAKSAGISFGAKNFQKAKNLITDLRNTVQTVYNSSTGQAQDFLLTPFNNASHELMDNMQPILKDTVEKITWIMDKVGSGTGDYVDPDNGDQLHLNVTSSANKFGFSSLQITLKDSGGNTIGTGTVDVTGSSGFPSAATLDAAFQTPAGELDVNVDLSGTVSGGKYTNATMTGTIKDTSAGVIFDFSSNGRKLYVTFGTWPAGSKNAGSIYPANMTFSGLLTTNTLSMEGDMSVAAAINMAYSQLNPDCSKGKIVPKTGEFQGTFEAVEAGQKTGTKFVGDISGSWDNATSYNRCMPTTTTNFMKWTASFDGTIEAPSKPKISASLGVKHSSFYAYAFTVAYAKDYSGTHTSISGSGSYNTSTKVLSANLTNQDGLKLVITFDMNNSSFSSGSGIYSGNSALATFDTVDGMPRVKFNGTGGYFESLF